MNAQECHQNGIVCLEAKILHWVWFVDSSFRKYLFRTTLPIIGLLWTAATAARRKSEEKPIWAQIIHIKTKWCLKPRRIIETNKSMNTRYECSLQTRPILHRRFCFTSQLLGKRIEIWLSVVRSSKRRRIKNTSRICDVISRPSSFSVESRNVGLRLNSPKWDQKRHDLEMCATPWERCLLDCAFHYRTENMSTYGPTSKRRSDHGHHSIWVWHQIREKCSSFSSWNAMIITLDMGRKWCLAANPMLSMGRSWCLLLFNRKDREVKWSLECTRTSNDTATTWT